MHYPIGMLNDEASLVADRIGVEQAAMGIVFQAALMTMPTMGIKESSMKRAHKMFSDLLDRLTGKTNGE
jgi:hypothetical protein